MVTNCTVKLKPMYSACRGVAYILTIEKNRAILKLKHAIITSLVFSKDDVKTVCTLFSAELIKIKHVEKHKNLR